MNETEVKVAKTSHICNIIQSLIIKDKLVKQKKLSYLI